MVWYVWVHVTLENRFHAILVAICTQGMAGFAMCFRLFQHVSDHSGNKLYKAIALLLSVPCFRASHFFFKLAYALNQRHLLRLCGEDFFLKFYDRRVANGGGQCRVSRTSARPRRP